MSYYFSASIHFDEPQFINTFENFIGHSRPFFIEDVEPSLVNWFTAFEDVEFASSYKVNDNEMLIRWYDMPDMTSSKLKPVLDNIEGVNLMLAYEIDDYADCSDDPEQDMDGFFIYQDAGAYKTVNRATASKLFSDNLIENVSKIEED